MYKSPIDQYNDLTSLLINSLPAHVNGSNEKNTANYQVNRNRERIDAIRSCKFIHFNTPKRVSLMMFDIDKIDGKKAVEVYSLYDMFFEIFNKTNKYPTFILQTDNGFHFAFHLENHVYLEQPKAKKYLQDIKRAISTSLQCDDIASNRLYGIWRNPLKHEFWFSGEVEYALNDFDHLVDLKKYTKTNYKKYEKSETLNVNLNDLTEGSRNNTLFKCAVNFCNSNLKITYDQLYSYLNNLNVKYAHPRLEDNEISSIATGVFKRKEAGTLYKPKYKRKDINYGAMKFQTIKGLSYKDYLKETKYRQSLSAQRTNSLLSTEAKQKAMKHARKWKLEKNKLNILNKLKAAISFLKQEGKKITFVAIAEQSKLDRRTAKKYVLEYNLFDKG